MKGFTQMNYCVISGSHQKQAQSLKIANFINLWIKEHKKNANCDVIALSENPLPLWDESFWSNDPKWEKTWKPYSQKLQNAQAIIVISPEWAGMVPAGLKNFFLFCNKGELAHKPGLIVSVSAGTGGAYPVNELRTSSYKNSYLNYIPDHLIIRKVGSVFNQFGKTENEDDAYLQKRLAYSINMLEQYALAMNTVRGSGVMNLKDYPFGM